jgi:hypothetical protein
LLENEEHDLGEQDVKGDFESIAIHLAKIQHCLFGTGTRHESVVSRDGALQRSLSHIARQPEVAQCPMSWITASLRPSRPYDHETFEEKALMDQQLSRDHDFVIRNSNNT